MGSRIATIQRQARELGRLRSGYTDYSGTRARPVRSKTWIVTSHAEHYVQAAAALWGGAVEKWKPLGNGAEQFRVVTEASTIEAILPPGDPLSQSYEVWNRGGCARRCDGITEAQADAPCYCRARWGEDFHAIKPASNAPTEQTPCKMTTRLNLLLPQMPDVGVWRVETHSFYAANEIAASVDLIRGAVGPERLVPVVARIEPRTRVAEGKTKQFPVIVIELRGATAGQILAAATGAALPESATGQIGGSDRVAIEGGSGPRRDYVAEAAAVSSLADLKEIWDSAGADGSLHPEERKRVGRELIAIRERLEDQSEGSESELSDTDTLYGDIMAAAPEGWDTARVDREFAARNAGVMPGSAEVEQLRDFLAWLNAGAVAA